ncbi:MAG: GNAT family N-acetyltransferase [Chloroflexia bacterium]|nr:GNAT family N-acetyltransferase [Chloroflexia bacterium]
MGKKAAATSIVAAGDLVVLRDHRPSDADHFIRWRGQGEWREYDAPWEQTFSPRTAEEIAEVKERFRERCEQERPVPRTGAVITTPEDKPLGWVNRYANERFPDTWYVGIDICEDDHLNQGLGTQVLQLWVDYLFGNSEIHRIALDTWSFNPRMMRVAEKLGFVYKGAQRELIEWQGQRLDFVHYGMLRREWE